MGRQMRGTHFLSRIVFHELIVLWRGYASWIINRLGVEKSTTWRWEWRRQLGSFVKASGGGGAVGWWGGGVVIQKLICWITISLSDVHLRLRKYSFNTILSYWYIKSIVRYCLQSCKSIDMLYSAFKRGIRAAASRAEWFWWKRGKLPTSFFYISSLSDIPHGKVVAEIQYHLAPIMTSCLWFRG